MTRGLHGKIHVLYSGARDRRENPAIGRTDHFDPPTVDGGAAIAADKVFIGFVVAIKGYQLCFAHRRTSKSKQFRPASSIYVVIFVDK